MIFLLKIGSQIINQPFYCYLLDFGIQIFFFSFFIFIIFGGKFYRSNPQRSKKKNKINIPAKNNKNEKV